MGTDRHFFATREDLAPGIRNMESQRPLKYVLAGKFESPDPVIYESLLEFEHLGVNFTGSHIVGPRFLVTDRAQEPLVQTVPQRRGGIRYFIDQALNPGSIVFWPGGLYEGTNLVCGHINTGSESEGSVDLYREFSRTVTAGFKHIGSYFVGPKAQLLMNQGIRMVTISVRSPREYDLRK